MRAGQRQQAGKQQRLREDLGIRHPRVPDLDQVEREQGGGARAGGAAGESRAEEIEREHADDGARHRRVARSGETGQPVADRDRRWIEVRELVDDGARHGVQKEEPHEPRAVVGLAHVLRKEEVARGRRQAGDERVLDHEAGALRDLHAGVEVDAGVLAAQHVLRRRRERPQRERDEPDRRRGPEVGPRRAAHSQSAAPDRQRERAADAVNHEQAVKAVAAEGRQDERGDERDREADHHGPERTLARLEGGAARSVADRQPEDQRARQIADDERGGELRDHRCGTPASAC